MTDHSGSARCGLQANTQLYKKLEEEEVAAPAGNSKVRLHCKGPTIAVILVVEACVVA